MDVSMLLVSVLFMGSWKFSLLQMSAVCQEFLLGLGKSQLLSSVVEWHLLTRNLNRIVQCSIFPRNIRPRCILPLILVLLFGLSIAFPFRVLTFGFLTLHDIIILQQNIDPITCYVSWHDYP